jgi:hypothetical protein
LTVDTGGYGTAGIYLTSTGWKDVSEKWVDANTNAWVRVDDLLWGSSVGTYGVYICPNQWAGFVNWTGGATGVNVKGPFSGKYWIQSNPINMTGPKTGITAWKFFYMLYVTEGSTPPPTDPPSGAQGWYEYCTYVNLTAPDPHLTWNNPGDARWAFDYWELDGVKQTPSNVNLTVHMDKNHTATVYYKRQSWLTLADNLGNQSEIEDTGGWYDNCMNYTFTAPQHVYRGGGIRYEFVKWRLKNVGKVGDTPTVTLHIDNTYDAGRLIAIYKMQFLLTVTTDPAGIITIPPGPASKYYDSGTTVTINGTDVVPIDATSRWKFDKWTAAHAPGWWSTSINYTTTMDQPKNFTAHYNLEYLMQWDRSPTTITVVGMPSTYWAVNGTMFKFRAKPTDVSGIFQFYYWEIEGTNYAQGKRRVKLLVTGPMTGTAFYANQTAFYLSPSVVDKDAHADYCTTFEVDVIAANFEADRKVSGKSMAIFAMDFKINFNTTLLRLDGVDLNLDEFWAGVPEGYYTAKNEIDNTAGTYWLSATVQGNHTGFEGTRVIATLTFHIIYAPCYNQGMQIEPITISPLVLMNNEGLYGTQIWPEHKSGTWYLITPPKPVMEISDTYDGDNSVIVHRNAPTQTTFEVDVWLLYGIKVHDFWVKVTYNDAQIEVVDVTIADYLKPPYKALSWWKGSGWVVVSVAQEDPPDGAPLQNCSGILFSIKFKVVQSIFWKKTGPFHLTSTIAVDSSSYISVRCPTPTTITPAKISCSFTYNPQVGDVDFDGEVTVLDLDLVAQNYCTGNYDITGDSHTDIYDLVIVALNFGKQAPPRG